MTLKWQRFAFPLLGPIDAGGGGGDGTGGQEAPPDTSQTPDGPMELADDAQVRFSGSDKPMSVKDIRSFQAQWTRAAQEAARLKQELQARDQRLAEFERQRQASQSQGQAQGQNQRPDIAAQLEQLPYLDGAQAASVIRNIQSEFQNRDRILLATLQELKNMKGILGQLNDSHVNSGFDSKINGWIREGGYPDNDAVRDLMKEVYLAYEGDNLDQEFPAMFKARWDGILAVLEAQKQANLARARQNTFVPGKGGGTGPTKPLQLDPKADARTLADSLWDSMQG